MAARSSGGSGLLKFILVILFAGILVLGIFLSMNRSRGKKQSDEDNMVLTPVQEITTMNLELSYPENEREVVILFGRIMQTLYNQECTDKEIETAAAQLLLLYDDEFVANQTNYPVQLKQEVRKKKTDGYTIQNYVVVEKKQVVNFKEAGRECAGVECTFSVRNGTQLETTIYIFILRKDEVSGRWKIFGFEPKEDQNVNLFSW